MPNFEARSPLERPASLKLSQHIRPVLHVTRRNLMMLLNTLAEFANRQPSQKYCELSPYGFRDFGPRNLDLLGRLEQQQNGLCLFER